MNSFVSVKDPFGNHIELHSSLCDLNDIQFGVEDIFDDISDVIKKPSLVFQMKDGKIEHYYFRAIGWNVSLLIGTVKTESSFQAYNCIINPAPELIGKLYVEGKQLV